MYIVNVEVVFEISMKLDMSLNGRLIALNANVSSQIKTYIEVKTTTNSFL